MFPVASRFASRPPMEAQWKQEGENRDANLQKTVLDRWRPKSTKLLKSRRKRKFCVIARSRLNATHNLKVVGSNPTPATIFNGRLGPGFLRPGPSRFHIRIERVAGLLRRTLCAECRR